MATVSITSNEGALESASAVLEVVATNPEYTRLKADAIARNLSTQVGLFVGHRRRVALQTRIDASASPRRKVQLSACALIRP